MTTSEMTYRLSGIIRHMRLPVKGVEIRLYESAAEYSGRPLLQATTGPAGDYNVAVAPGRYALQILPADNTRFVIQYLRELVVTGNQNVDITLTTGFTLSGQVSCGESVDFAHYRVWITDRESDALQMTTAVNFDGSFSATLPRGSYQVTVAPDPSTHADTIPRLITSIQTVNLNADQRCQLHLPNAVAFRGIINDSAGQPVSDVSIETCLANASRSPVTVETKSDSSGFFELAVQPGCYDMRLNPPESSGLAPFLRRVSVTESGEQTIVLSDGHRLNGMIGFNGEPVIDCRIDVKALDNQLQSAAVTDEQGAFVLKLPEGSYELTVAEQVDPLKRGIEKSTAPWRRYLKIEADSDLLIELQEGYAIRFDVHDEHDNPLANCTIVWGPYNQEGDVLDKDITQRNPEILCGSTITTDSGVGQLTMTSGVYFFQFQPPEGSPCQVKHIRQLSISTHTRRKVKMSPQTALDAEVPAVTQLTIQSMTSF